MMRRLLITALALLCHTAHAITFEEANTFYDRGQFDRAGDAYERMAKLCNADAQYNLAVMYARGEGREQDMASAYAWARLASDAGQADAPKLVKIARKRLGGDAGRASERYGQVLAMAGPQRLQDLFPDNLFGTAGIYPLYTAQPEYPRSLARNGNSGWADLLVAVGKDGSVRYPSLLYQTHDGFGRAALDAIVRTRYQPERVQGAEVMTFGVKYRYIFQMKGAQLNEKSLQRALSELKAKAGQGGSDASYAYAFALDSATSFARMPEEKASLELEPANPWYSEAARYGSSLAEFQLGLATLNGRECKVDPSKASFWLESAADRVLEARFTLAHELLSGVRLPRDEARGLRLMHETAEAGLDHAKVHYAWLQATQMGKPGDLPQATQYLQDVARDYPDLRSQLEAQAALALARSDWSTAAKRLKKLAKINRKWQTDTTRQATLEQALARRERYEEVI